MTGPAERPAPSAPRPAVPPPAATPDIVLSCEGVGQAFGAHRVLTQIDLRIARGQIVALVGPSGSGKSTLLRAILGTHPPSEGRILVDGAPVQGPGRDRGIVYQRYTLFPFLTALDNVAFGLMLDRTTPLDRMKLWSWPARRRALREEAAAMLEHVGLGHAKDKYPAEMSGGMCQRVAIAQALVMRPRILLLDEPFGALDEATREQLQQTLLGFYQDNLAARARREPPPYTILIVTHELNEAIYVSDRVLGLSQYWDWRGEGHAASPGATIVYDQPAPIFTPTCARDYEQFEAQRRDIRRIVMEPTASDPRGTHVNFWPTRGGA